MTRGSRDRADRRGTSAARRGTVGASAVRVLVTYAPNIRFHWLETDRVLVKTCDGFVTSKALRETYAAAALFVEQEKVTRILSDNRDLHPTGREDLDWIEREWLPRMVRAGWRSWAVVGPTSALGAMHMRRWVELYGDRGITVRGFTDPGEAIAWLRTQPDAPVGGAPGGAPLPPRGRER